MATNVSKASDLDFTSANFVVYTMFYRQFRIVITPQAPAVEPMWYLCESVMLGSRGETC